MHVYVAMARHTVQGSKREGERKLRGVTDLKKPLAVM